MTFSRAKVYLQLPLTFETLKRSFYVLSLDIIFVPFAGAVLMLERPLFDGG